MTPLVRQVDASAPHTARSARGHFAFVHTPTGWIIYGHGTVMAYLDADLTPPWRAGGLARYLRGKGYRVTLRIARRAVARRRAGRHHV